VLGAGLTACGGEPDTTVAAAPATQAPPSPSNGPDAVDLAGWRMTLPVPNDEGNALVVDRAAINPPWITAAPGGGLDFWSPAQGSTTENSDHPRTELVSRTLFKAGQGVHTLRASVTIHQVPRDGQGIILGQIHGADDISSVPYVMLRYQEQTLKVVVKQVQDGTARSTYTLVQDMPLNTRFDFVISDLGNGQMTFSGTPAGRPEQKAQAPIPAEFTGATVRFQAGDYQQSDDPAGPTDGGRVVFHKLSEVNSVP
jgi:hypothetical protein